MNQYDTRDKDIDVLHEVFLPIFPSIANVRSAITDSTLEANDLMRELLKECLFEQY